MIELLKKLALAAVSIAFAAGCTTTQKTSQSPRTTIEQLLISEAALRSLPAESDGILPIPQGSGLILNTAGISSDQSLLQQALAGWLGRQGYSVHKDENKATHRVNVVVGALGTEIGGTFIGMPPVQSALIPFSLPELALYKSQYQTGYIKFHMDIFELPSGTFVRSTPPFLAESYYNDYTVLFLFSFTSTDLLAPPHLGPFREPVSERARAEAESRKEK